MKQKDSLTEFKMATNLAIRLYVDRLFNVEYEEIIRKIISILQFCEEVQKSSLYPLYPELYPSIPLVTTNSEIYRNLLHKYI